MQRFVSIFLCLHPWPTFLFFSIQGLRRIGVFQVMCASVCQCVTPTMLDWIQTACGLSLSSPERNASQCHSVMFTILIFEVWQGHKLTVALAELDITGWFFIFIFLERARNKKWNLEWTPHLFVCSASHLFFLALQLSCAHPLLPLQHNLRQQSDTMQPLTEEVNTKVEKFKKWKQSWDQNLLTH